MSTKKTLLSSITETETQLKRLQEQLTKQKEELTKLKYPDSIQEAEIGDEFEDGTILFAKAKFDKYNGIAFFVGPTSAQFHSDYHNITRRIADLNYTTRWFVPYYKLLKNAIETVPEQFETGCYWTSGGDLNVFTHLAASLKKDCNGPSVSSLAMPSTAIAAVRLFTSAYFDI
jgi:hypothetical protein